MRWDEMRWVRGSKPQSVLHHVFKALDVLLWTLQINEKQETQALPSRACNLLREAVLMGSPEKMGTGGQPGASSLSLEGGWGGLWGRKSSMGADPRHWTDGSAKQLETGEANLLRLEWDRPVFKPRLCEPGLAHCSFESSSIKWSCYRYLP